MGAQLWPWGGKVSGVAASPPEYEGAVSNTTTSVRILEEEIIHIGPVHLAVESYFMWHESAHGMSVHVAWLHVAWFDVAWFHAAWFHAACFHAACFHAASCSHIASAHEELKFGKA